MTNVVKFQDKELELVSHNNQQYMTLSQIGIVLEYANPRKVSKLYNEHKSEFDEEMSCLIKKGNTRVRLFNREGAWLIGMFARTPKAMEFRKWVLKVLGTVVDGSNKEIVVSEYKRALPSGKKEIVLSEKARTEVGGIVKAVINKALDDKFPTSAKNVNIDCLEFLSGADYLLNRTMLRPYEVVDCLNYLIRSFDKAERTKNIEIFCRMLKGISNQIVSYETILSSVRSEAKMGSIGNVLLFANNQDRGVRIQQHRTGETK